MLLYFCHLSDLLIRHCTLTSKRLCSHASVTPAEMFPTNRVVCAGTPPAEDGVGPTGMPPIVGGGPIIGGGLPIIPGIGGGPPVIIIIPGGGCGGGPP